MLARLALVLAAVAVVAVSPLQAAGNAAQLQRVDVALADAWVWAKLGGDDATAVQLRQTRLTLRGLDVWSRSTNEALRVVLVGA